MPGDADRRAACTAAAARFQTPLAVYVQREVYVWKETYMCEMRGICVKRDLYV